VPVPLASGHSKAFWEMRSSDMRACCGMRCTCRMVENPRLCHRVLTRHTPHNPSSAPIHELLAVPGELYSSAVMNHRARDACLQQGITESSREAMNCVSGVDLEVRTGVSIALCSSSRRRVPGGVRHAPQDGIYDCSVRRTTYNDHGCCE
jgi:hypothetical protein